MIRDSDFLRIIFKIAYEKIKHIKSESEIVLSILVWVLVRNHF